MTEVKVTQADLNAAQGYWGNDNPPLELQRAFAAHRSKDGVMHGHSWQVTCWWAGCPDAVEKKAELEKYLSIFDHTVLADGLAWGEKLAEAIMLGLGCARVDVERPLEGIFARMEGEG